MSSRVTRAGACSRGTPLPPRSQNRAQTDGTPKNGRSPPGSCPTRAPLAWKPGWSGIFLLLENLGTLALLGQNFEERGNRMSDTPAMIKCFLCDMPFQFGPHVYGGRRIPEWDIMVCNGCYQGNWDGIVPARRSHLVPYLQSKGIEVKYNAQGWINWPS